MAVQGMGSRHVPNTFLTQLATVLPLENIYHSNVQPCEMVEIDGPSCSISHIASFRLYNSYIAILDCNAHIDISPWGPVEPLNPESSSSRGNAAAAIPSGSHFETAF
jgi:hypothetical protein